ncbi:MAG: hypothetical protein DDT25_01138 [Chloroflexi bacterium]|nr:hypothetical protein [Chloroflexota bacterium]
MLVPISNGTSQRGQSGYLRIPMVDRVVCRLAETLDDMGWGGEVGIAHGKADHILTAGTLLSDLLAYPHEKVRR